MAAFEKSLSNMTCRLQSLTMTAEKKVQQLPVQNLKCLAYEVAKQWLETGKPFNSETAESNHPNDSGVMDILSGSYSRLVELFHLLKLHCKYMS